MAKPSDQTDTANTPPDSLAALMIKYGAALQHYFARKAGPALADDLVQEVFLRLQASRDRQAPEEAERYLFMIAKRVLIDRRRFDARRGANLHDPYDEADAAFVDNISPERILAAKQDYQRVLQVILELPPRMRMAVVLHRFGRLSFTAIGKRMQIKKSTVQMLIQGAVRRIMRDMEDRS